MNAPIQPTHFIYHANCSDGFASAFICHLHAIGFYVGQDETEDKTKYLACQYGDQLPELPEDADVLIADFSWSREILLDLKDRVRSLVVLDHHETARVQLEGLEFAQFDMEQSGCSMTWRYFFGEKRKLPLLFQFVQDRDLWKWELPLSREANARIQAAEFRFDEWLELLDAEDQLSVMGHILIRYQEKLVKRQAAKAIVHDSNFYIDAASERYTYAVLNCTNLISETLHQVLEDHPNAQFAMGYFDAAGQRRVFSLRGRGDFNVAALASSFGGGGHKNAASFSLLFTEMSLAMWPFHSVEVLAKKEVCDW